MTTVRDFINREQKRIKALKDGTKLSQASVATNSMQWDRIFNQGLTGSGTAIGKYNSTDEIYVNPKDAPVQFSTKGKNGETRFKNGKSHVTGYFKSYKAFRGQQGRETDKVNLTLFGNLKSDYATPPERVSANEFVAGVNRKENIEKINGLEEKYGPIFRQLTTEEEEFFFDNMVP